jgi:hypothetical protein
MQCWQTTTVPPAFMNAARAVRCSDSAGYFVDPTCTPSTFRNSVTVVPPCSRRVEQVSAIVTRCGSEEVRLTTTLSCACA